MNNKYLLEIGVEEIPARLVENSLSQLEDNAKKLLEEERIEYEKIKSFSTPRRLTIVIEGIADKQKDLKEVNRGPSKKIAFKDGKATKALEGFMKGQGIELEDIIIDEYKDEEYVFANIVKKGKSIDEILPKIVPEMIKNIQFPKAMKWGGRDFRFIRPIRWIVSILNSKVLNFEFENIPVSNITRGHRFLGSSNIEIEEIDSYEEIMKENYVVVDSKKRYDIVLTEAERLVKERGGNLDEDEELINEIVNIVEYPTAIIGKIKEEYLELPQEVLITPMKEHQRYLPVFSDNGKLLPYFITVRNGNKDHIETVVKGNERVLEARLEDAKFFFEEDKRRDLESYVEDLKNITFQEKLGSMYDKVKRVEELTEALSTHLEVGEETEKNAKRAAYLSKADLVTNMVNEFSELQGVMGKKYAEASGENNIVAQAIEEQYLPGFDGDALPKTTAGMILSIADKLDTICGLFAIGIKPTGSQDPFALRRQALAIINLILDKRLNVILSEMIETSLYIYIDNEGLAFDANKVKSELQEFFNIRVRNILRDEEIRYDVVDSVVGTDIDDIYGMKLKAEELSSWLDSSDKSKVLEGFNRISNLTRDIKGADLDIDLLENEELSLYEVYRDVKDEVNSLVLRGDIEKALFELEKLEPEITKFFDNVMVMVEDEKIRQNRLSLLKNIDNLMLEICDLSKIVI